MADTVQTEAELQTAMADNTSRAISPQILRNLLVSSKVDQFVVANSLDGVDIGAKINTAIASLGANGGDVQILAGVYTFSTPINMGAGNNIRIIGQGGVPVASAGDTNAGTQLIYEGADTAIYIGDGVTAANGGELHNFQLFISGTVVGVKIEKHFRGTTNNFSVVGEHSTRLSTGIETVGGNNTYGWLFYNLIANYHNVGIDLLSGWGTHFFAPRFVLNKVGAQITSGAGTFFHGGDIELNDTAGIDLISDQQTVVRDVYFESKDEVNARCIRVGSGASTPESVVVDGCRFKRDGTAAEYAIELAKVRGAKIVNNYFDNYATSAIKNAAGATEIEYDGNTVHSSLPLFIDSYAGVVSGYDPVDGVRIIANLATASAGLPSGALWRDASDSNRIKMVP